MRIIIVDDEPIILAKTARLLQNYTDLEIVHTFSDPIDCLEYAEKNIADFDAAFLDITMPEISGLELASQLNSLNPRLLVVFITAFDSFAVSAFEQNAIDYILKPVSNERLAQTIDRLRQRYVALPTAATAAPNWSINCFSKFRVNTAQAIKWGTKKTEELLAYLLVNRPKSVHKDKIIDNLWPDYDYDKAVVLLQSTVYRLRKILCEIDASSTITLSHSSYTLQLGSNCRCDWDDLHVAIQQLKEASMAQTAALIDKIVDIAADGLFTDNDWEWKYSYESSVDSDYNRLTGEWLWVEE